MPAGYSGTPLPRKLGIKEGHRVGAVRAPSHLATLLEPLPAGARLTRMRAGSRPYDVLLLFAHTKAELADRLDAAYHALDVDGGLWICWPKKSSPLHRGLVDGDVRTMGLEVGLVDNKVCAVDEDWSGLRFVFRTKDRAAIRAQRG